MTRTEAETYVSALKEKYPHPVRVTSPSRDTYSYCVGGCLAKEANHDWLFPDSAILTNLIEHLNPGRKRTSVHALALCVIRANDCGDFEKAWKSLTEALTNQEGEES